MQVIARPHKVLVKNHYRANVVSKPIGRLFFDVLNEYSEKTIKELSLKPKTIQKYKFFIANIQKFLEVSGQMNIALNDVRIKTMEEMRFWLQNNLEKCSLSHASRHAELCKRVMNYAVLMEYTLNNPLSPMRAKRDKIKEVVHLEAPELLKLAQYPFKRKALRKCADLYVFQCYTGLSYADLFSYSVIEKDGRNWISNRREKNDTPYYVPMFTEAKRIHDKYDGKLPRIANQYYNRCLKEIAEELGIKKHLTSHTGRKTFATHRDNEGWSTKTIADMLGNTLQVLQKHYLAKSTKRIEKELESLGL